MADNFYGITDTGKIRDNNEDSFIASPVVSGKYIAGCVIDGVGGYEGGEIAAALARVAILNTLKKSSGNILDTLKQAFNTANEKIFEEKKDSEENMQMACVATLALADINENKFYYAHVGDTRLYLLRDHSLIKVTHDHSFVGFLEESGRLSEEAAMLHPRRNEINKAMGFDAQQFNDADYIETGESPFLPGDILLLCSDGLSDMLHSKIIAGILNEPASVKEKCKELINAANGAGGKDNITVVVIQNNKLPAKHEATKPLPVKKDELTEAPQAAQEVYTNKNVAAKKGIGTRFLIVLCFVLMAALALLIYNDYFRSKPKQQSSPYYQPPATTVQFRKLSDSIKNTTSLNVSLKNIYTDTSAAIINDSLQIMRDTLFIHGNGKTLIADSSYNGSAFVISSNCKNIFIDSLTFENFNTAIIARNKNLHLNNVRFKNCGTAISYAVNFPDDKNVSAIVSDSSLIKIDSVQNFIHTR